MSFFLIIIAIIIIGVKQGGIFAPTHLVFQSSYSASIFKLRYIVVDLLLSTSTAVAL